MSDRKEAARQWLEGYVDAEYTKEQLAMEVDDYADFALTRERELWQRLEDKGLLRHVRWVDNGDSCSCGLEAMRKELFG